MRAALWFGISMYAALSAAATAENSASIPKETAARPAVVELFTSQGCSSCPPAEALLGSLAARRDVIALAFHVDYWDNAAWHDRYSIPQAAPRQQSYVHALHLTSAFTPQVVIDGRTSVVGSDRNRINAGLAESNINVPIRLTLNGNTLDIDIADSELRAECDVYLAAYLSQASTAVGGGENSGRRLEEYNIVRLFTTLGHWAGAAHKFSLPLSSLPSDANYAAVLLQRTNYGEIAGAAALPLRSASVDVANNRRQDLDDALDLFRFDDQRRR